MTPNELVGYLFYEVIVVPVAWTGDDLPIGDTEISILFRVVFSFMIFLFVAIHLIRFFVTRPIAFLWAKLRRKEFDGEDWESLHGMVAMWGGFIVVLMLWAFYSEWLNM